MRCFSVDQTEDELISFDVELVHVVVTLDSMVEMERMGKQFDKEIEMPLVVVGIVDLVNLWVNNEEEGMPDVEIAEQEILVMVHWTDY